MILYIYKNLETMWETIQIQSFRDWLNQLNLAISSYNHFLENDVIVLFFIAEETPLYVNTTIT